MSISQHEAVSLLNHTVFRPGWRVSARPANDGKVMVRIEIETVDSSFVTRAGEYKVPLTERALIRVSARDYATPEALLFRVLAFIGELQAHEDREFWRTWNPGKERWEAPFHSHAPEGAQAWAAMQALPQPPVERVSVSGDGPWLAAAHGEIVSAACDMEEDRGDCWESGNSRKPLASATGCEEGINDQDCWENGKRALVEAAAPCNDQTDDDEDIDGPQRVLADADCTLGPPERALVKAGCAQDGEVNCNTNIDTPLGHHRMLAHAMARPAASDPCMEDHGGCAEWGK